MVPALLSATSPLLARHQTVGCSTGFMESERGNWQLLAEKAAEISSFAIELSAISEPELSGLLAFLATAPSLPFHFVSVHGPSKARELPEDELAGLLERVPPWVDAIVMHPDVIDDPAPYRRLGRRLTIENMDTRKPSGHRSGELTQLFQELPEAGLCLDVAHAKDVDPSMDEAKRILDDHFGRLRHLHISSLDDRCHHIPLTREDQALFADVLKRCGDVPWILEAPPPPF